MSKRKRNSIRKSITDIAKTIRKTKWTTTRKSVRQIIRTTLGNHKVTHTMRKP